MLNLKKTAIAVLAFSSSAVFAGTMGPVCTPGSVTIPCEHSAWDFAGQALYLKPSAPAIGYLGQTTVAGVENYNRDPLKWGWGFKLEGSYHFNTGNDLDLNWYHMNNSNSYTLPTTGFVAPNGVAIAGAVATSKPKWDAVNLEFGQHVDLGEFAKLRYHGGIAYARTQSNTTLSGTGTTRAATRAALYNTRSRTYNGFGPRVGADLMYGWNNGFNIYANAASALFVGTSSFNETLNSTVFTGLTSVSGSQTVIVPEMEAKLGATYTYAMAQGDLSLDAGWMWINYFNALQRTSFAADAGIAVSDFGLQGPYIGLKWVGNVV